jgi:hypothetical protein
MESCAIESREPREPREPRGEEPTVSLGDTLGASPGRRGGGGGEARREEVVIIWM